MSTVQVPQGLAPGDFAVVSVAGAGGTAISLMETAAYGHHTWWDHALIYIGGGQVVQAEPGGAQTRILGPYRHSIWSTGLLPLTGAQRALICGAAVHYAAARTGYSWLDYAAIAAHRLRLPVPRLREFIGDTGRLICSQLVDQCWRDGGVNIFADGRWPGYVSPYDLGALLQHLAAAG